ncbi:M16 family metallopeptidase [Marivirga atlantica]|jgi:zinc protease|uniref:Insulinase family protein n=1 Tax=Marivirga atlantica TaxID=1548457 RepID=A0A937AB35_9BACT|nr:pitrilysin family protein [Marivirga atlantica]MBL0765641.1 insulinase family protein [Marivirga atlantica]
MKKISAWALTLLMFVAIACQQNKDGGEEKAKLSIDFEKYTLPNGLEVILHQDKSDPIVAVAIQMHVGSNREKPGRTGFAHFFEHMLFQKSENVEEGAFFKNINDLGGTFNGGTWSDGTVYYEVVPKDALERILWMESDRMGFFINAITEADLEGEKPVVKNEKRQRVDNNPYGHRSYVIKKALYPEGHPYNWEVIGELEDLEAATMDDVKEFYEKWYGPNNGTLVIAGDFDKEVVKEWIEKYFGEIESRGDDKPLEPMPVSLEETKKLYYEDEYAKVPDLRMVYPSVEQYHPDSYALSALGEILSQGKRAELYKKLVEETEYAPNVFAYNSASELAGEFIIGVRAKDGIDLDSVHSAIMEALDEFEQNGFSEKDLQRIKARQETNFYNGISSVLGKAFQLSNYNEFAGDPGFITQDIEKILAVTKEDVMRVYDKYIKGKPYVMTSFVPKGQLELIVDGSEEADVKIEEIVPNEKKEEIVEEDIEIVKTASKINRAIEPALGEAPLVNAPTIYESSLANGMKIYGIQSNELPLVNFSIRIKGGQLMDKMELPGVANLMTDIMQEGTKNKTPEELEDAIGQLGASINMYTSQEYITVSANCLARYFDETVALVEEMLLEPRWDEEEFARIKTRQINNIKQRSSNPNAIASQVSDKILYGDGHIFSQPIGGSVESVEKITIDDLKAYYENNFAPNISAFHIAGNVSESDVKASLSSMNEKWAKKEVAMPEYTINDVPEDVKVYFANFSNAKQSVIRIQRMAVKRNDPDYFPLTVANYGLGGNSGALLFQELREKRQYTYGAYSNVGSSMEKAPFSMYSSVKTNVTPDAVAAFKEVLMDYMQNYDSAELEKARTALIRQEARAYETLYDKLGILQSISTYNLPNDYIRKNQEELKGYTIDDMKEVMNKYMNPEELSYFVVGDAATQLEGVRNLEIGEVIRVDENGNPVDNVIEKK